MLRTVLGKIEQRLLRGGGVAGVAAVFIRGGVVGVALALPVAQRLYTAIEISLVIIEVVRAVVTRRVANIIDVACRGWIKGCFEG